MTKIINGSALSSDSSPRQKMRRLNLRFLNFAVFSLVLSFGVLYLINISDLTVKGFALKEFKSQANSLKSENLTQEETANNLQSYYSLNTRTQKLNMVTVDNIEYLTVATPVVAKK